MANAQYAILRFAKYKGPEISGIEAHNERTMETQMKKYQKCFITAESEKKALKKKNDDLTAALEKSQQQSTLKKLQEAKLQQDYADACAILDRIPPEIIREYTNRSTKKQEVRHYR